MKTYIFAYLDPELGNHL